MTTLVTTQTDFTDDGLAHVWSLYDDGTVTITDGKGGTINAPATADTIAQAQAFKTAQTATSNEEAIRQALAGALPGLAAIDTQLAALSTLTLSGTTAQQLAQVQAALRGVGTNLRPMVAGVRRAVRLLSNTLDGTT